MNTTFRDILDRIAELPSWYDQNGTPRYGKFEPDMCPDIYSDTVVLLRIHCQDCSKEFDVEMHEVIFGGPFIPKKLHYGDPPAHGCVGDSMNCNDYRVLECWHREAMEGWRRCPEYEGEMR